MLPIAPEKQVDENVISNDELSSHLTFFEKALVASRRDVRRRALLKGFLHFGTRFAFTLDLLAGKANYEGPLELLRKESEKLLRDWMLGRLTKQADEDDRRAQMAVFLLQQEGGGLGRLAAKCIMALPEDHEQRDLGLVRQALSKYLAFARDTSNLDEQVLAIKEIIQYELEPHEQNLKLIAEGTALLDSVTDPSFRHYFRNAVLGYYVLLAIKSRDDSKSRLQKKWARKAKRVLDQMKSDEAEFFNTAEGINLIGLVTDLNATRPFEAVSQFAAVVDSTDPKDESYQTAATIEAQYRLRLKDYQRVVKVLSPIVSTLEQKYLSQLNDMEIAAAGVEFSSVVRNLAFAHAHLGQWDDAVRYLERGKSLSFRYAGGLRESPKGRRLLKLERKLYALGRGVPVDAPEFEKKKSDDWLGAGISLKSKILETYRTSRPRVSSELLTSPSIKEIAQTLARDEAVAILGVDQECGTMMVVVCRGDTAEPTASFIWEQWPLRSWAPSFAGEQQDGWLYAVGAPELELDGRRALIKLLKEFERRIGKVINACLEPKRIRHLGIIPHLWFHLVPFWTLPSLGKYHITMGASVAHFMQSRRSIKKGRRTALIVADPTGDLPVSLAEADAVEKHVAALNFKVRRLDRQAAQENEIVRALRGSSIFHFCGHGRADSHHPNRSALLVYPDFEKLPLSAKEPFEPFVFNAQEWKKEGENERSTLIPKFGRLYERLIPQNQTMERRIEYGERGTLWGRYRNGTLKQVAEMWTAGDILVEGSLNESRLVFLSACEVGGGSLSSDLDEYSGLPAALQLAGASTIICSLWPISDALTALYVDLFYKTLSRCSQSANVVAIVQAVSSRLRRMKKTEAVRLLDALRRRTASARARFILEAYAGRIKKGKQLPFSHPYDWGAFYVTGASTVFLAEVPS